MTKYKYETHLHTSEGSACGSSQGFEYIPAYVQAGYSGIIVTDHFFGGNTAVPKNGEWKDRIEQYCSGYEHALSAAQEYNKQNNLIGTDEEFKVFFGIEQTFHGDDYLIYGLNKQWLLEHPQIETMNLYELFNACNMAGALVVQAHPFRLRDYIKAIHLHPRECHAVEIYNAGNQPEENELATLYAKKYNFPVTSGSDIHNSTWIPFMPNGLHIGGMEFDTPLKDISDYIERIKTKQGNLIK